MDYQRQSNGWTTFLEHHWILVIAIIAMVGSQLLSFFTSLTGAGWIWCYAAALLIAGLGISLIFYSKLPLYRQRQFFTFGSAALPETRRSAYRWGWRCVVLAIALLLCLFLSLP